MPERNPVAIGALGGSGTRMIAQFLCDAGYYLGDDLNRANDNLWFTLLFRRRDILVEPRCSFDDVARLFFRRMRGIPTGWPDPDAIGQVSRLVEKARPSLPLHWLKQRARTFLKPYEKRIGNLWGWKAPNTHIVIDRLLEFDHRLRYIHVNRHGLDMAFSSNQNQLRLWGDIFLGREIEITPRDALAYWCAVHKRMQVISKQFPGRILFVDFDRLCVDPSAVCRDIIKFLDLSLSKEVIKNFASEVVPPTSMGAFRSRDRSKFATDDVAYLASLGYPIS